MKPSIELNKILIGVCLLIYVGYINSSLTNDKNEITLTITFIITNATTNH